MKNITVSVDDDVYRQARVVAAQRSTSVSAMVAEFLRGLGANSDRFQKLLKEERRLRKLVPAGFNAADRLPRDQVYERGRQ